MTVTQNPYQQQAPQPGYQPVQQPGYAYPSAQPGGYPPPGYPQVQPEQQPPSANPFTQPGQAGAPASGDEPFGNPGTPGSGGDSPAIHQLAGRLLLIRPLSYDPLAAGYQGGEPGPLVRADVIVCDGEPISGNLNANTGQLTPFAAGPKVAPFHCGAMYIRGAVMPGQLEGYVAGRGQCLGRVVKGQPGSVGKPPWMLADPSEQDKVLGRQIHAQWDQIKAASAPARPDQFGAPQGQQQQAPTAQPAYGPTPGYQPQYPQVPTGYPGAQAQNPYGAPTAQPAYPPYPTH